MDLQGDKSRAGASGSGLTRIQRFFITAAAVVVLLWGIRASAAR